MRGCYESVCHERGCLLHLDEEAFFEDGLLALALEDEEEEEEDEELIMSPEQRASSARAGERGGERREKGREMSGGGESDEWGDKGSEVDSVGGGGRGG